MFISHRCLIRVNPWLKKSARLILRFHRVVDSMAFEENKLLFGSDPTPRIVGIELGETGTVKVYRREKNGSTLCESEEFHPFVWCDSDVTDLEIESEKLGGNLPFGWLVSVNSWKE